MFSRRDFFSVGAVALLPLIPWRWNERNEQTKKTVEKGLWEFVHYDPRKGTIRLQACNSDSALSGAKEVVFDIDSYSITGHGATSKVYICLIIGKAKDGWVELGGAGDSFKLVEDSYEKLMDTIMKHAHGRLDKANKLPFCYEEDFGYRRFRWLGKDVSKVRFAVYGRNPRV